MSGAGNEGLAAGDRPLQGDPAVLAGSPLSRLLTSAAGLVAASLADERPRFVNWLPVLFGLGIWIYFALPSEPTYPATVLPIATGLVMLALTRPGSLTRLAAGILVVAGLGVSTAKVRTEWVRAPILERTLRAADVTGVLERREPHAKRGERLTVRLVSIAGVEPEWLPVYARIRLMSPGGDMRPGDTLRLTATLSPPAGPALPGGFDFGRTAYFERIGAVGFALKPPEAIRSAELSGLGPAMRMRMAIEDLRQSIGRRIEAALPGERGALAAALITGERGGISEATTDAYRDSGLVHILSISGLHMAIMAGAVFSLLRFLMALVTPLALTRPIKKYAAAGGAVAAVLYYAISGGSAATLRAAIMMIVMFLAVMLGRPAIAMRNVALAALLILAAIPESLLDVGFQMSFAAVAALVAAYEAIRGRFDRAGRTPGPVLRTALFLGGVLFSTLIAGLAVTPLSIYHFHAMQHYAPLANLVAVPACNLIVMPAALATLVAMPFGLEAGPLWIMGLGIDVMGWVAHAVAALPGAVTRIPAIPTSAFAVTLAGGLWLVLWQRRWRLAGLPLVATGLMLAPATTLPDIYIGREGALVAVREPAGRLAMHAERPSTYELKRWLEHDGDTRTPTAARSAARIFRCDALGCATGNGPSAIAISRHPGGLADDCARSAILVSTGDSPAACAGPALVFDRQMLQRTGTVALYRNPDGSYRSRSVADVRGERPWSMPPLRSRDTPTARDRAKQTVTRTPVASDPPSGITRYAAPALLLAPIDDQPELRPEIEADDDP